MEVNCKEFARYPCKMTFLQGSKEIDVWLSFKTLNHSPTASRNAFSVPSVFTFAFAFSCARVQSS